MRISRYIWSLITVIVILALSTTAILWFVSCVKALTQTGFLRQQKSTPQNNNTAELAKGINIGLVEPTFTYAAYHNTFYTFYEKNLHTPNGYNITSNLNLLSKRVVNHNLGLTTPTSAFAMLNVLRNLKWLTSIDNNVTVLTDAGVDNGSIFEKHIYNRGYEGGTGGSVILSNTYDVLILGHQEYVTQQEYNNLKQFVANGGTLILLDGNVFYAEVKYDQKTETITLVKGHGWAYNGKTAWRSVGGNNQSQQKESTLEIIFSSLIALFLIAAGTEFSQNVVLATVKTNSTNMMITDTDTKMMMNGFSGMSLNNKTGTMTMNSAQNGMMLMFNNKTGVMVMMNPANDTIAKKTGILMKTDRSTGITMLIDRKTGLTLDPQTEKMLSSEAGKMAMQNESGMMMGGSGMTTKNMMK